MNTARHPRQLLWDACRNVRDLGGLPASDGSETRWGALIRADNLSRLTAAGQSALAEYGVRTVVDLRGQAEIALEPHPYLPPHRGAPAYLHLPFATPDAPRLPTFAEMGSIAEVYKLALQRRGPGLAAIATAIARAPEGGVLVHCHAGKDRTGIVVALLLSLVGVPDVEIAADYALSTFCLWGPDIVEEKQREPDLEREAPPEVMFDLLEFLRERYGGAEAYLRSIGVDSADIARLFARLR